MRPGIAYACRHVGGPLLLAACCLFPVTGLAAGTGEPALAADTRPFADGDAQRHHDALLLFRDACLRQAPGFTGTVAAFETAGLSRPEEASAFRRSDGVYAGLVRMQAGQVLGNQCTVMLESAALPVLIINMRLMLGEAAIEGSLNESPPKRRDDPVLWDLRLPGIGLVTVTAALSDRGIGVVGMQVADRLPGAPAGELEVQ